ncbi:hypothetical protein [Pseudovibrio sp. Tun.PSC04-5.I4]|uniref:hypothetical protein n=1 Tax=Pseudovibrio sp. Tun.PSC04-5.I4 TaxID=1798213 RepID=UPI000A623AAA|nr:hypothetical protein [Pseudovibrio sp. Tun.PSC04-5.I4]
MSEDWNTIGQPVEVSFYRRPLSMLFGWLANAGLCVVDLHEGTPAAEMKEKSPVHYEKLTRNPNFIFFKCARHSTK